MAVMAKKVLGLLALGLAIVFFLFSAGHICMGFLMLIGDIPNHLPPLKGAGLAETLIIGFAGIAVASLLLSAGQKLFGIE